MRQKWFCEEPFNHKSLFIPTLLEQKNLCLQNLESCLVNTFSLSSGHQKQILEFWKILSWVTFCIECICFSETQHNQNIVSCAEFNFKVICNEIRNYKPVLLHSFSGFTCGLNKAGLLASCHDLNMFTFIHSIMNITS